MAGGQVGARHGPALVRGPRLSFGADKRRPFGKSSRSKRIGALSMTVTGTDGLTIIVLALAGLMAARLFIEGMRK